jgi:hypothetical protein
MDITEFRDLGSLHANLNQLNKFPKNVIQKDKALPLLYGLSASNIKTNLISLYDLYL